MKITTSSSPSKSTFAASSARTPAVPSRKLSGEALLLSAIVHTGDVGAITTFGLVPEHFKAWQRQFQWIQTYVARYEGAAPSVDAFRTQFPDFPLADHYDVRSAVDMMMQTYYKQQGVETIQKAAELFAADEVNEAATLMQQFQVRESSPVTANLVHDSSFLDMYFDEERSQGIPLPWKPLQDATGGIHPGNLMYLAARTGQGKSSLAVEIACNAVEFGFKVKYFSLEMTEMEMRYKVHARCARELGFKNITARRLKDRNVDRDEYKKLLEAIGEQERWGNFDVHTPRQGFVNPMRVLSEAENYDLVVVDLISLMMNNRGQQAIQDWRFAAEISNELKQIALATKVPVLGTLQINRDGALGDQPPKLHQLAQSDSFGQDADIVATLRTVGGVINRWSIEKSRWAAGKRFNTVFDPNTMHFPEINDDRAEDMIADAQSD